MRGSLQVLGLLVALSAPLAPHASADTPAAAQAPSEAFAAKRADARARLVAGLLELAKWCEENQLFLERDRIHAQVVGVDPDNADARKALRHRRGKDGAWQAPPPTKVMNRNPKALPELAPKEAAVVVPFCDVLLELVDGPEGDPFRRRSVYDEILAVDPEEPRVHERLGDVKIGEKWMTKESAVTKAQRDKIKEQVKASLAGVPKPQPKQPTADEAKLVGSWSSVLGTDRVRVLSTGDAQECERMVQVVQTAGALLEGLLGTSAVYPEGYTIYMVTRPEDKAPFIARLPNIPSDQRKFMLTSVGGGIHNTFDVAVFDADPKVRLDLAVRCTYGPILRGAYNLSPAQGFAFEGLGLYLTREILGTRLTWWVVPAKAPRGEFFGDAEVTQDVEAQQTRARLMNASTNWLAEALKLYEAGTAPKLQHVTRRHVDKMTVDDMLVSYALTAYLLEGRPDQANDFYASVGSGDGAEAAAKNVLDLSLPDLEKRLHRWLRETR